MLVSFQKKLLHLEKYSPNSDCTLVYSCTYRIKNENNISNGRIQLFSLVLEKLHFQSVSLIKVIVETVLVFHSNSMHLIFLISLLCNFLKLCKQDKIAKLLFANLWKIQETKKGDHRNKHLWLIQSWRKETNCKIISISVLQNKGKLKMFPGEVKIFKYFLLLN